MYALAQYIVIKLITLRLSAIKRWIMMSKSGKRPSVPMAIMLKPSRMLIDPPTPHTTKSMN